MVLFSHPVSHVVVVQLPGCVRLSATPWTTARQASLSLTVSWSLPNSYPMNPWCHPTISSSVTLFSFCLQMFPSIRIFSNESAVRLRWPKYWSFSYSINYSNEYLGLISFRVDWFDLFAVQGTLKNFLQHYSSKVSILQCSAFSMVQLSHPYMTTGNSKLLQHTCLENPMIRHI